jgi:ABC-type branched-subunit amino acid transport system substrate-binding protein
MRTSRKLWVAVVAALCVGLSVACGGGSGGGSGPITMAELFPVSGREAFVGQWFVHGAKAAVTDVNNNGGVMGRQLKENLADTGGDPVDAVPAWRKLETSKPAFEIGPSSLEIQGVIKNYDSAKLVDFMEGGTAQVDHMQYKYVWRTTPSDTTLTAAMAYYAIQKHLMNAVMFFETTSDATAELDTTTKFFTAHGGKILDTEKLALHQSSYRSEVAKAFATNPDVVFVKTDPQTGATLFNNAKELGHLNVPYISDDGGVTADEANAMGMDNASKYLIGVAGAPPEGPAWQHYLDAYAKAWNGEKPQPNSQNTYDGVIIAALAMTAAKTTDGSVWVDKIKTVSNPPGTKCYTYGECVKLLDKGQKINYEGATGPNDFDRYHNVFGDWDIAQFKPDGQSLNVLTHMPAAVVAQYMAGA